MLSLDSFQCILLTRPQRNRHSINARFDLSHSVARVPSELKNGFSQHRTWYHLPTICTCAADAGDIVGYLLEPGPDRTSRLNVRLK